LIMWAALLVGCAEMPAERANLLARHSWLMGGYGILIVIFRFLVAQGLNLNELIHGLGAQGDTALLMGDVRRAFLPYTAALLWVIAPLTYLIILWQRYSVVRAARGAHGTADEIIAQRVGRGEDRARPRPIAGTEDE